MAHHAKFGAAKREETGSEQEFLTRTIKKVLDEETTSLENGLTMLAIIGATALCLLKTPKRRGNLEITALRPYRRRHDPASFCPHFPALFPPS